MRYQAACDLYFASDPRDVWAPLDCCPEGTDLVLVSAAELTRSELDSLKRLTNPDHCPPDVRILPFRWQDRIRFLRLGSQARAVPEGAAATPRRVQALDAPSGPVEPRARARRAPRD